MVKFRAREIIARYLIASLIQTWHPVWMFKTNKRLSKENLELETKLKEMESKMLTIRVQYILMRADRNRLKEELGEKNGKRRDQEGQS